MAKQDGVEGSDDMDVDNVHPNAGKDGGASTVGLDTISPPATSSISLLTHATHAAAKASQPTRKPGMKKSRAESAALVPMGVEPAWFTKALKMLKSVDGGESWTRLLDIWSEFEAQE